MKPVNHAVFPPSLIAETIAILQANGARFVTPSDFLPAAAALRSRWDYLREHAAWHTGRSDPLSHLAWCIERVVRRRLLKHPAERLARPGRPEVFLQHDADRNPENTVRVLQLERSLGAVSAAYFFRERHPRWPGDHEPYELDLGALQELERDGFEIGYHLNGPERAGYDPAAGWRLIREDLAFFRSHFRLRSFVPHGGVPGPDGKNNHDIPHRDELADLIWFYNGRGLGADLGWSDGLLECPASIDLPDPREIARRVRGRLRARFLFHPQYYGDTLRPNLEDVGVTRTGWWRALWHSA
jgi:hypothetical protein